MRRFHSFLPSSRQHYIFSIEAQQETRDYLTSTFGDRMHFVLGPSEDTIPAFARDHPGFTCDFVSIDGAHSHPIVYHDIRNMRTFATEQTLLMMDDVQSRAVRKSLQQAIDEGLMGVTQVFGAERYSLDWSARAHSSHRTVRTECCPPWCISR